MKSSSAPSPVDTEAKPLSAQNDLDTLCQNRAGAAKRVTKKFVLGEHNSKFYAAICGFKNSDSASNELTTKRAKYKSKLTNLNYDYVCIATTETTRSTALVFLSDEKSVPKDVFCAKITSLGYEELKLSAAQNLESLENAMINANWKNVLNPRRKLSKGSNLPAAESKTQPLDKLCQNGAKPGLIVTRKFVLSESDGKPYAAVCGFETPQTANSDLMKKYLDIYQPHFTDLEYAYARVTKNSTALVYRLDEKFTPTDDTLLNTLRKKIIGLGYEELELSGNPNLKSLEKAMKKAPWQNVNKNIQKRSAQTEASKETTPKKARVDHLIETTNTAIFAPTAPQPTPTETIITAAATVSKVGMFSQTQELLFTVVSTSHSNLANHSKTR